MDLSCQLNASVSLLLRSGFSESIEWEEIWSTLQPVCKTQRIEVGLPVPQLGIKIRLLGRVALRVVIVLS
jgi:hypothetical protein